MLITTLIEFRTYVTRISKNYTWEDLVPYILKAEIKYIVPAIGQEFYDELVAAKAATPTPEQTKAIEKLQFPIAYFAMLEGYPIFAIQIGNAGIGQGTSQTTQPQAQWQAFQILSSFADDGERFLDIALEYLEKNISDYSTYADSEEYTIAKELFVNTAKDLSRYVPMFNSRRAFQALRPYMRLVQTDTIPTTIGQDLYDYLLEKIKDSAATDLELKLIEKIGRVVALMAARNAFQELAIAYNGRGFRVLSDNDSIIQKLAIQPEKLQPIISDMANNANTFLLGLKKHLQDNATDWPLYQDSDAYIADNETKPYQFPDNSCRKSFTV